jgi:hypothetical protein
MPCVIFPSDLRDHPNASYSPNCDKEAEILTVTLVEIRALAEYLEDCKRNERVAELTPGAITCHA